MIINPIHKRIKYFEIATSLTLLAMTGRIEFFRNRLKLSRAIEYSSHSG